MKRWFYNDWRRIENKLRTSIVEGISVFLSLFDDNPMVKRTFCPPKECYDPKAQRGRQVRRAVASVPLADRRRQGLRSQLSGRAEPGLAKAIGVMMKLDFQRAVRKPYPQDGGATRTQYFRQVFFICDEYQHFATVGENDPTGDEKFFSLSRQPKCIPIVATQSISSLRLDLARRDLAHAAADLPNEDLPGPIRRVLRQDRKRTLRQGGPMEGELQHLGKWTRRPRQLLDRQGHRAQSQRHHL